MIGRIGKLVSINTSRGGVPKHPTAFSTVNERGLENDRQLSVDHGGADRAICLYSMELINALRAEGHPIDVGTIGENFTVQGVDWSLMRPGAAVGVGPEVRLEVTSFTAPCKEVAGSFLGGTFKRISEKVNPGWSRVYARVVAGGTVETGYSIIIE